MQYSFEKLDIWNKSKDFAVKVYSVTKSFPNEEKFGLISQLRRSSISISSNIAEGSSRTSSKEQGRFYTIAFSSTIEVLNQLIISKELEILSIEDYQDLRDDIEHITAMINRLHNSTQKS
jgi:four helix bundle protein